MRKRNETPDGRYTLTEAEKWCAENGCPIYRREGEDTVELFYNCGTVLVQKFNKYGTLVDEYDYDV